MADTGARVVGPTLLSAAAATVYTVPGATTLHILDLYVVNQDAAAARTFTLSIGADAAGTRLYDAHSIEPKGWLHRTGFIVVTAGEIIQAYSSVANELNLTISGVLTTP